MNHDNLTLLQEKLTLLTPDNPACRGWSSYSQCDEDGIIRECLERIGKHSRLSKTFVEVGCGDGKENNTHQLLLDGYIGAWIDGDDSNIESINDALCGTVFPRLNVMQEMVSVDNASLVAENIRCFLDTISVDFFSLDIDGNDLHCSSEFINCLKPKLICVEYNAKIPVGTAISMKYNPDHSWQNDDYFGASLEAWVQHLAKFQYSLVSCNISGANAFFVRDTYMSEFTKYSTKELYQPARYDLTQITNGHPASLGWLKQELENPSFSHIEHSTASQREVLVAKTRTGHMMVYKEDETIGQSLLNSGAFQEDKIIEVCDHLIKSHDFKPHLFVDIGANIGTHSIYALKKNLFQQAVMFEPDPYNFHLLKRNIGINAVSEVSDAINLALSDVDGEIEMELSSSNFGDHRIRPTSPASVSFGEETERAVVKIDAISLDTLHEKSMLDWREALVWLDTQGHEGNIFKGGSRFLTSDRGPKFIVSEFWPYGIERANTKDLYFAFLRKARVVFDINQEGWQEGEGIPISELEDNYVDMLARTEKEMHPHSDLLIVI